MGCSYIAETEVDVRACIAVDKHGFGALGSKKHKHRLTSRLARCRLTRGESRHAPARDVCHGHRGELRQRYRQGQEEQLGPLVNAIVLYITIYTSAPSTAWPRSGSMFDDIDGERLSPLGTDHVTLTGRYRIARYTSAPQRRLIAISRRAGPDIRRLDAAPHRGSFRPRPLIGSPRWTAGATRYRSCKRTRRRLLVNPVSAHARGVLALGAHVLRLAWRRCR